MKKNMHICFKFIAALTVLMNSVVLNALIPDLRGGELRCSTEIPGEIDIFAKILASEQGGKQTNYRVALSMHGSKVQSFDNLSAAFSGVKDDEDTDIGNVSWVLGVFTPDFQINLFFYNKSLSLSRLGPHPFCHAEDYPEIKCSFTWPVQ